MKDILCHTCPFIANFAQRAWNAPGSCSKATTCRWMNSRGYVALAMPLCFATIFGGPQSVPGASIDRASRCDGSAHHLEPEPAAQGLDLTRAVLAFWVGYAAAELKPVYLRLRELILASGKIAVNSHVLIRSPRRRGR
jgi:hypothetical protein